MMVVNEGKSDENATMLKCLELPKKATNQMN